MQSENIGKEILAGIVSSIFFLITFVGFNWNIFVSLGLALLLWLAISLLATPVKKIGSMPIAQLEQGERLSKIYNTAQADMKEMQSKQKTIKDHKIQMQANSLLMIGTSIMNYLTNHPQAISQSEHFLDYYLNTANRILKNYITLQNAQVSEEKWRLVQSETAESLTYLNKIFTKQRDSYFKDTILQLEVESDLLEKTIELGGGRN